MGKNLLIVVFLVILTFSSVLNSTTQKIPISRPWQEPAWETNQDGILDLLIIKIYYNMGYALNELELNEITNLSMDSQTTLKINNAKEYSNIYLREEQEFLRCQRSCILRGELISISQCIYERLINEGLEEGLSRTIEEIDCPTSILYYDSLEKNWKKAMEEAMDALENSQEEVIKSEQKAREQYEIIKFAGLCREEYNYPGKQECKKLENAFQIIDNEQKEEQYGKINIMKADILKLNSDLVKNASTTTYPKIMKNIWDKNGIISTFNELKKTANDAKDKADDYYAKLEDDANQEKFLVDNAYKKLEKQKLDLITESVTFESIDNIKSGKISERWESLADSKKEADTYYENAKKIHSSKVQDYLLIGIRDMKKANESYHLINNNSEILLQDAQNIVDEKRVSAKATIENVKTQMKNLGYSETAIEKQLSNATEALKNGDKETVLGLKYKKYVEAITIALVSAPTKSADYDEEYKKKIAELEKLIENAKKDGIYVDDLKIEIDVIKNNRPANEMELLQEIKDELENRIKSRFYDLEKKRKELEEKLKAAGASDLLDEMKNSERGIVKEDGSIDWLSAVGKLNELNKKYDEINEDLESNIEKKNAAITNQLIIEPSLIMPPVNIDEPTEITYTVSIYNPQKYGGKNIKISIQLEGEFKFYYSDIVSGSEDVLNIQTNGKTLYIILKSIEPFDRKTITFKKKIVLATTKSTEMKAKGLGYEKAAVKETRVIMLSLDNAQIKLPQIEGVTIDNGDPLRKLNSGVHTIKTEYIMNNAYKEERTDAEIATKDSKATVSYRVMITPLIDLEEVPLNIDSGIASSVSINCGVHKCVKQQNGYGYTIFLQDLKKGIDATILVSYTISNISEYVLFEIYKYKNSKEQEIVNLANEAENLLKNGKEDAALAKVEEIKKKNLELEKNKAKLLKEYYELSRKTKREIEDLQKALEKAQTGNLENHSQTIKFRTRKEFLLSILNETTIDDNASLEEIQKAVDKLKAIDENWLSKEINSIAKEAQKKYESYKREMTGISEAQTLLKKTEEDINVLLATQKAEDGIAVLIDLLELDNLHSSSKLAKEKTLEELSKNFNELKDAAQPLLLKYETEYKDSLKSDLEKLFNTKPEKVKNTITAIEKYIKNGDIENANSSINDVLIPAIKDMNSTLEMLSSSAYRKIKEAENDIENKKNELSVEQLNGLTKKLNELKEMYNKKNYIKTIVGANILIDEINKTKGNANTMWYILAASLILIGVLAFYMLQKNKNKPFSRTVLKKNDKDD
ncbi:MAG: hypothetical protein QXF35_04415 [Candidatus Bilamarchaeaceae archaeon]